jgi:hypothetical protein
MNVLGDVLGATRFEQGVISMSLINMCDRESHVSQEMRKAYSEWKAESDEAIDNPWRELHQFTIFVPHPDQEYDGMTLEEGLTQGYNVEVSAVRDKSQIPYKIPEGGHFVIVLKQKAVDGEFTIAATGMFVRPLGVLNLDVIVDGDENPYQALVIKHPIIRDYPSDWQDKLAMFYKQEIPWQDLPNIVGYVDRALNPDYRPPSWHEVYLGAAGFSGF